MIIKYGNAFNKMYTENMFKTLSSSESFIEAAAIIEAFTDKTRSMIKEQLEGLRENNKALKEKYNSLIENYNSLNETVKRLDLELKRTKNMGSTGESKNKSRHFIPQDIKRLLNKKHFDSLRLSYGDFSGINTALFKNADDEVKEYLKTLKNYKSEGNL